MSTRPERRRKGFTLVEMLVVLGIIVVIMSLALPAIMRARRAGRQTLCMNNLRQIGMMYLQYAEANHDYIPLGTSTVCACTKLTWRTDWNDFIWAFGSPGPAGGCLLAGRYFTRGNVKLLYCPTDPRTGMTADYMARYFPASRDDEIPGSTIRISYSARPIRRVWNVKTSQCQPGCTLPFWPDPMPRLDEMHGKAIFAESPGRPPFGHGNEAEPRSNVLFWDGSVKTLIAKPPAEIRDKFWYEIVSAPYRATADNDTNMAVWESFDHQ